MDINLNIVLVEDETIIAEYFKTLVEQKGHKVELLFEPKSDFKAFLQKSPPNLVFLDINLESELNGLDLAKSCFEIKMPFIFMTSYSDIQTIQSAMQYDPLAYILKPFSEDEIFKTLEIAKFKLAQIKNDRTIELKDGYDILRIKINDILWLKADNVYTEVVTKVKTYVQRHSLKDLYDQLPKDLFFKTHRSYVINISSVTKIASDHVEIGTKNIPLSRGKKSELYNSLSK